MTGPMEQEAARLVGAVHDWVARTFPPPDAHPTAHAATGAPECAWCPVCQLIAVLRGDRPEVTERLAEAGTALLDVARSLLDGTASAPTTPSAPSRPDGPTEVQKIRLTEPSEDGGGTGAR